MPLLATLDQISVDVPCEVPWETMSGGDCVRYCAHCQQSVYNIAAMSQDEALSLVNSGQSACVRILRRPDGTVIARDCRLLLRAIRSRLAASFCLVGALLVGIFSAAGVAHGRSSRSILPNASDGKSFWEMFQRRDPPPTAVAGRMLMRPPPMMGKVCPPPAVPAPPANPPINGQ